MTDEESPTLSIPSLAIVAVIGYLVYRYFFSGPSTVDASQRRINGLRFTPAQVQQVSQIFPQVSQRDIMWDLQRNGGSVQATIERLMGGRSLEVAPPSFQPQLPDLPTASSTTPTTISSRTRKQEPDLITRYNLQSKLDDKGKQKETEPAIGWAPTQDARQRTLQQRRDEMILAARRRMQERDAQAGSNPAHLST